MNGSEHESVSRKAVCFQIPAEMRNHSEMSGAPLFELSAGQGHPRLCTKLYNFEPQFTPFQPKCPHRSSEMGSPLKRIGQIRYHSEGERFGSIISIMFHLLPSWPLLAIDEFGLIDLDLDKCRDLFKVIDGRDGRKSTIIVSQFPIHTWLGAHLC